MMMLTRDISKVLTGIDDRIAIAYDTLITAVIESTIRYLSRFTDGNQKKV